MKEGRHKKKKQMKENDERNGGIHILRNEERTQDWKIKIRKKEERNQRKKEGTHGQTKRGDMDVMLDA